MPVAINMRMVQYGQHRRCGAAHGTHIAGTQGFHTNSATLRVSSADQYWHRLGDSQFCGYLWSQLANDLRSSTAPGKDIRVKTQSLHQLCVILSLLQIQHLG